MAYTRRALLNTAFLGSCAFSLKTLVSSQKSQAFVSGFANTPEFSQAPGFSRASRRPQVTHGVQSGDISLNSGMIWARSDRPAMMQVSLSTTPRFDNPKILPPIDALPEQDFCCKRLLTQLPAGEHIFYRVQFADYDDPSALSEPVVGHFKTASNAQSSIRFVWGGDTAGQGWGIDVNRGGMRMYASMAVHNPDFFIHSGDAIYADAPLSSEVVLQDGSLWKNIITPAKQKVAETLEEFRGQWQYNLLDENLKQFNQNIPTFFQWDDHEVVNNWYPEKSLEQDDRYQLKTAAQLAARSKQAFYEYTPLRYNAQEPGRIYRKIAYGPLLDIFFLDLRSYRGSNAAPLFSERARHLHSTHWHINQHSDAMRLLGHQQLQWLMHSLKTSKALWKVIASDMPLGLWVQDDKGRQLGVEAVANGDPGNPQGRELEIAYLLQNIKQHAVSNVVWLTADVHYAAAHHYSPERASFTDFLPFWEFVAGPLHAGTFGEKALDSTFGPEVRFIKAPTAEQGENLPPSAGYQFFGLVDIDAETQNLSVRLMDQDNVELYRKILEPVLN